MWERFLDDHSGLLMGLGASSAFMFVASLVIIPMLIVRIRPDYFVNPRSGEPAVEGMRPAVRWSLLVLKNVAGGILLLLGIAMLVGPGQGVITILLAFSLLNFPGKRKLEAKLLRIPGLLRTINRLRQRAGREPVVLPE
jgi:hypothetical protein